VTASHAQISSGLADVPVPRLPPGLETPCLVVDLDVVERNARRLQAELDRRGVRLRPHVKTHKSVALAGIQTAAGAAGLTVGTLGEAEVMAAGGFTDLFLAYPLWADGAKATRLRGLHESGGLIVGVDSNGGAERLAAAVSGSSSALPVMIEVDSGGHRSGVGGPEEAVAVGLAARALGLRVVGVFTHGGHGYAGPDARASAAADEVRTLGQAADALAAAGFTVEIVSAGSTPTAVDAATGQVNEIRAGTYLLGDRQQVALGSIPPDAVALHVAATVVSTTVPGQVILDAGAKCLTKDVPPYLDGHGLLPAYPSALIGRVNDYHGIVRIPDGTLGPRLGEVVAVIPNHVCPVVDLFDTFMAVRDGAIVGRWPVDARGRSG
jgi:D-serine deaminase-like pyridoxal phosphate-dependent protein